MELPTLTAEPALDSSGNLSADLPCRRCAYNLRGLRPAGRCPECGLAVDISCHADVLRYADPGWLKTLQRGTSLILWSWVAALLLFGANAVLGLSGPRLGLLKLAALVAALLDYGGAWLITKPEPGTVGHARYRTIRAVIRLTLLGVVALPLCEALMEFVALSGALRRATLVAPVAVLVGLAGEFAKLVYFQRLAERIPNAGLARWAHRILWAMAIVAFWGPLALLTAAGIARTFESDSLVAILVPYGVVVVLVSNLVVSILILVLTYGFANAFRQQAELARAIWTAGAPGTPGGTVD